MLMGLFFFLRRRRYASISEKLAPRAFMDVPSTLPSNPGPWTNPESQSYGESYHPHSQYSGSPQHTTTMSSSQPSHQPHASAAVSSGIMTSSNLTRSELSDLPNAYGASPTSYTVNVSATSHRLRSIFIICTDTPGHTYGSISTTSTKSCWTPCVPAN